MSSFKFKNSGIKVDIEGWKYTVPFSKATPEYMKSLGNEMIETGKKNLPEADEIKYIDSKINDLLGLGSSERIFKGREAIGLERVAVLEFIIGEISKYHKKLRANNEYITR